MNEKWNKEDQPIEEEGRKINPRESDVIQTLRKTLRLHRRAVNTEKAYVGKVRAFMRERGLKCLADFEEIGAVDVESHLTDLAVDGAVAATTTVSSLLRSSVFVRARAETRPWQDRCHSRKGNQLHSYRIEQG